MSEKKLSNFIYCNRGYEYRSLWVKIVSGSRSVTIVWSFHFIQYCSNCFSYLFSTRCDRIFHEQTEITFVVISFHCRRRCRCRRRRRLMVTHGTLVYTFYVHILCIESLTRVECNVPSNFLDVKKIVALTKMSSHTGSIEWLQKKCTNNTNRFVRINNY